MHLSSREKNLLCMEEILSRISSPPVLPLLAGEVEGNNSTEANSQAHLVSDDALPGQEQPATAQDPGAPGLLPGSPALRLCLWHTHVHPTQYRAL